MNETWPKQDLLLSAGNVQPRTRFTQLLEHNISYSKTISEGNSTLSWALLA